MPKIIIALLGAVLVGIAIANIGTYAGAPPMETAVATISLIAGVVFLGKGYSRIRETSMQAQTIFSAFSDRKKHGNIDNRGLVRLRLDDGNTLNGWLDTNLAPGKPYYALLLPSNETNWWCAELIHHSIVTGITPLIEEQAIAVE
ncbi:MAG: hypothetical protein ACFHHU_00095 [Porticoccaceae bacterium]